MGPRLNLAKSDNFPAPNAYDLNKLKVVDTPEYTFGSKGYQPKRDDTPGEYSNKMFFRAHFTHSHLMHEKLTH